MTIDLHSNSVRPARPARRTIALVAHDDMKSDLIEFARRNHTTLSGYDIMATDSTGARLRDEFGWSVDACGHGPNGGDVAIAAAVAAGQIAAVVFLYDPSGFLPHDHDCQALIRQCCVHNVPFALNVSTASAVTAALPRCESPRLSDGRPEHAKAGATVPIRAATPEPLVTGRAYRLNTSIGEPA
ncbi:methylglyoxal synthase [Nocardia tengchongensis]|uniref:methylglyoxal synthase n=1 Tax=Nocardia tengchongensis TaxID=2055889 RepID=UPI003686700F